MHDRTRFLVGIAVFAAVALAGFFYLAPDDSPGPGSAVPDNVSVAPMSSSTTTQPQAPVADSHVRLAVNGVVMAPASRAALIAVDDKPAALFVEGAQVADGVVLLSVGADRVVVKRGDELVRLPLRGKAPTEGGSTAPDTALLGSDNQEVVQTPLPPPGTEERRIYQNRD